MANRMAAVRVNERFGGRFDTNDPSGRPPQNGYLADNGSSGQHTGTSMSQRPLRHRVLLLVGSIGPLGHLPASGSLTVAFLGIPLFAVVHTWPGGVQLTLIVAFSGLAVGVHHVGDKLLQVKDSPTLVWDELAGFLVAVAFVPFTWQLACLAFALERVLDILKVPPANWVEDHVPGGWGVVGDDLVAGAYTCGVLHTVIHLAPGLAGLSG